MDPDQRTISTSAAHVPLLIEALGLRTKEVVSIVGGGGKTTLMFRLANEMLLAGKSVVTTTTTKILEPTPEESRHLFVDPDEERIKQFVGTDLPKDRHVTIATERLGLKKLKGVSSRLIGDLWDTMSADYIVVEADGAAGRPLKAPREWEPVIPSMTTVVIAVAGIDGIGAELNEKNVFQPDRVARLTGIPPGGKIDGEAVATLMTHPEGIFKGAPPSCRVVVFLNKMDVFEGLSKGREVTARILERRHPQIERIVFGQLKKDPPVVRVILTGEPA